MTTVNTTDDLLRAARENKEFREAFRREILTEELMAVPDDIKELKTATKEMADGINALVQGIADSKVATERQFAQVQTSITRVEGTLREQEQAQSNFRGAYAQSAANREDLEIAAHFADTHGLNAEWIETEHIRRTTLRQWTVNHRAALLSLDLKQTNPLIKFRRPDIIAAVSDVTDENATPAFYIAVEASYSAEKKDIDKATDNAKIVQAITGLKTYAVLAAVRLHRRIEDDDGTRSRLYEDLDDFIEADNPDAAFWYKVDSDDMRPPSPR